MYRYFVTFVVKEEGKETYWGNGESVREKRITKVQDLVNIAREIEQENNFEHRSIIVTHFQRFED